MNQVIQENMPSQTSNEKDWDDVLARFERHQTAKRIVPNSESQGPDSIDPWEGLLRRVETRAGVIHAVDGDGNLQYRVRSRYILTSVIGIPPERANKFHASRLGVVMRKLGWNGPKDIRFGQEKAKGYSKLNSSE